jgi:hypothetical protein
VDEAEGLLALDGVRHIASSTTSTWGITDHVSMLQPDGDGSTIQGVFDRAWSVAENDGTNRGAGLI